MTVGGVLLRLTTWRPERRRGVFGPFEAPANSAPPVGRVKATSLAVAPLGCLERLIPSSTPFSGVAAILRRILTVTRALATTYTPIACWPWILTPANSSGISSSRRTISSTMTRPKLPSLLTQPSGASRVNSWWRPIETVFSTYLIALTAHFSPPHASSKNSIGPAELTKKAARFAPESSQVRKGRASALVWWGQPTGTLHRTIQRLPCSISWPWNPVTSWP